MQQDLNRANLAFRRENGRDLGYGDRFSRSLLRVNAKATPTDNLLAANIRRDLPVVNNRRVVLVADGGRDMVRVLDPDRVFRTLPAPTEKVTIRMATPDTQGRPMGECEQAALAVLYEAKVPAVLLKLHGKPVNYTTGGLSSVLTPGTSGTYRFGGEDIELHGTRTEIDGNLYYPADDTTVGIEAKKLPYVLTEINPRQVGLAAQLLMELPNAASRVRMLYVQVMSKVFVAGPGGPAYADHITYLIHELEVPERDLDALEVKGAWQVELVLE